MSENNIIKKLEERYKKGEISRETYESIAAEYREEKSGAQEESIGEWGVSIAGSGRTENVRGEYLKIAGSGKVEGDVDVKEVKIAGSAKIEGNVRADTVKCSGSCHIEKDIRAGLLKVSGAINAEGNVAADTILFSGGMNIEGNIEAAKLKSGGALRCEGRITAKERLETNGSLSAKSVETSVFEGKGSIKLEEGIKCEDFRLEADGKSSVEYLESKRVEVVSGSGRGVLSRILGKKGYFRAERISGDEIYIENTYAGLVDGNIVEIGPGCRIETLKCRKEKVHESSSVKKRLKRHE